MTVQPDQEHPLLVRYYDAVDRAVDDVDPENYDFSGVDLDSATEALEDVLTDLDDLGPMSDRSATMLAEILVPGGVPQTPPASLRPVLTPEHAAELLNAAMEGLRLLRGERLDVANHLYRLADHPSTQDVAEHLHVVAAVLRSSSRWDRHARLPHHRHDAARLVRRVLDLLHPR